ncbi:MAG: anthranilate phosphoribosyltransferase [Methanothrix sp.]|uniref:anthranilate phosphoribosyltransferase n=1 Tax=Methanothrix sp. TaxID=90426 RepID=UPI0032AE9C59|nr:anthranilate phosphoribosyltransferase [Methanothrix sp.]
MILLNYLARLIEGQNLTMAEAESMLGAFFDGATDAQIASALTALRMKGETAEELAGMAKRMRESAIRIRPRVSGTLVDTCGTGGDSMNTINVSTAAAIVAAACGVPVAKHGNYAVSSRCGSANVLEALGVNISCPPDRVESIIESLGIGFMLAPLFHPAMKRVAHVRREMGIRTVFNVLGPLTNPAGAEAQVVGVYSPALCEKLANVLGLLGTKRAMVVHGSGLDEISNTGTTFVSELRDGAVRNYVVDPRDLGYPLADLNEIAGGTPDENAERLVRILRGEKSRARDLVAMNAGAAVYISGMASTLREGCAIAEGAISSGSALETLKALVEENGDPARLRRFL